MADLLKKSQRLAGRVRLPSPPRPRRARPDQRDHLDHQQGGGSLGKFVMEDEAYRRMVALSSRQGEGTLRDLEENTSALKHLAAVALAGAARRSSIARPCSSSRARSVTAGRSGPTTSSSPAGRS
ncbi:MAG: hypothetical protein U0790_27990 [Isosphaeraceae bacterium]